MNKKIISILICTLLTIFPFSSCISESQENGNTSQNTELSSADSQNNQQSKSEDTSNEDSITLEFFQQKGEEGPQKGYQQVIDKFHEEYPNIKIEMNTVPDAGKVLTARISSGDIPPIFSDYPTQMQFKQKVENGFVMDLSEQDFLAKINPSAIDMSVANDGKTYAMPYSNNFMGVYYNIDIFEENGIEIPKTFDELIKACEDLKTKGVEPLGLTYKDPGRVGHMFQAMTVAWTQNGVESIQKVSVGEGKIADDSEFKILGEKILKLTSYANEDAFGIADTAMWENFANGKYAMTIAGSYARGTILIANPDLNMGVFPLPNDTPETTNILTGVDAAICISASASDAEKEAGLKFLEFLSRKENAQIWCDSDGAPSCVTEVVYKDDGLQPTIDQIKSGQVHDWMASTVEGNVVTDIYNVVQGFLMDKNVDDFIKQMDESIEATSQS